MPTTDLSEPRAAHLLPLTPDELLELVDGVADLVQSVRPDGTIRFVNSTWLERLGYQRGEVEGGNIFEFIHPDSQEHCMHYMQRLLMGEDVGTMEVAFRARNGGAVHLEGRVTVQFVDGSPHVTRGVFRETTSHARHEASLRRLREQRKLFHSVLSILRANTSRDRQEFLGLVTRKVSQALEVDRVSVWIFDEGHDKICCEHLFSGGKSQGKLDICLSRLDHRAYFEAVDSKLPVRADDAHTHVATRSFREGYLKPLGITSMLDAPIRLGEEIAGVVCCEHTGPARRWSNEEEEFTLAVAAIVLIFLESERRIAAESKLQELNHRLEAMVEERTAKLAASEARLRYVLTAGPSVIYTCEAGGDFRSTYLSPNIARIFGYDGDEFLKDPMFWSNRIHPEDLPESRRKLHEALETGNASYEYRFRFPDGHYRWMRDEFMVRCGSDGKPIEIVGSSINIDARRSAENAAQAAALDLRRLIDRANAPIFGKDIANQVNEWNECAERITGYTKSEVIGHRLTDFVAPEFKSAVKEVLDRALRGIETANFEFPIVTKDGRHVLLLLNASTRRDAAGNITGMVGVGQDITEHRETERRSLRAQRLESIGTLAGGVAHDINNALSPILLATGLFRKRHPQSSDLIDVMESSARRGASMVQQLLTFAKGVDGKRAPVEPRALLREIEHIVSSTFPKNIEARFSCGEGVPPVVGDSTQLHQVLLNLCVNARDAMPAGGTLDVEASLVRIAPNDPLAQGEGSPGDFVCLRVADSGQGMAGHMLDRIFEPFFSTKSPEQGTGLGLSTASGIVRSHGGFMKVESREREGSVFSVYLPASVDAQIPADDPAEFSTFRGNGQTVLVVDDEPAVRDVFRQILQAFGLKVRTAQDGRAALEVLADPTVNIAGIVTDLHMPGMDGIELMREVRKSRPELRFILSSGRADRADTAAFKRLGVVAQLDKPFSMESLSEALRNLLAPP
ncbi:MAG: PAS domain S-box protein [Planctomycetaceae bacterium]|nr:PAS domain S-box protein [Planctomycetaceae bacterium]